MRNETIEEMIYEKYIDKQSWEECINAAEELTRAIKKAGEKFAKVARQIYDFKTQYEECEGNE